MSAAPLLHQVRTPEGYEGWQWMNGPVFLYAKSGSADTQDKSWAAALLALEWAETAMKMQRLQLEVKSREERLVQDDEDGPVLLNFEQAKAEAEANIENENDFE